MDPVMQSARKHLVKIYVRSLLCQHFKNQISNTGESPEWRSFSVILQATFFCLQDRKTEAGECFSCFNEGSFKFNKKTLFHYKIISV